MFAIGTPRESRTDLPGKERLLQYLLGVRAYSVDPDKTQKSNILKFKNDLRVLKSKIRSASRVKMDRRADELFKARDELLNDIDDYYNALDQQEQNQQSYQQ